MPSDISMNEAIEKVIQTNIRAKIEEAIFLMVSTGIPMEEALDQVSDITGCLFCLSPMRNGAATMLFKKLPLSPKYAERCPKCGGMRVNG